LSQLFYPVQPENYYTFLKQFLFQDSLGKLVPERQLPPFWVLMKQEMLGWQWH